jgi:aconitate hydratase 2/2-methylisocitrate dehydratase
MGNQARIKERSTCVNTSTHNFPNRLGKGANFYLASAELATVSALLDKISTPHEYHEYAEKISKTAKDTYRYMNFNEMEEYVNAANIKAANKAH